MKKKTAKSQNKSKKYRNRAAGKKQVWRLILLGIAAAILLIFLTGNKSLLKLYNLEQRKEKLVQEKKQLEESNEKLREEIRKLKTDEKYMEKMAREKFNMKKKNEDVYLIETK